MNVRFHADPDGTPHIHGHNVDEGEVVEALRHPLERTAGRDDSVGLIGRTRSGRVLRVICVPDAEGDVSLS